MALTLEALKAKYSEKTAPAKADDVLEAAAEGDASTAAHAEQPAPAAPASASAPPSPAEPAASLKCKADFAKARNRQENDRTIGVVKLTGTQSGRGGGG
eukprot:1259472-Pyramimonas_sp.AAC.1